MGINRKRKATLTVKMEPDDYVSFRVAAKLRGATPSSLVHQFAISISREERLRDPVEWTRIYPQIEREVAEHSATRKKNRNRNSNETLLDVRNERAELKKLNY